ncbi:NUDIX domain-containing protein [Reyranella sp.]|uniref:NUDIX hydrolase n=1 Tax=Reyranella sp. TaxID=1929291 RepID=UPI00378382F6
MDELPTSIKGVLMRDGRVLLLLNGRGEWDLPGGRPDPGEEPRSALRREVMEETGLTVDVGAALGEHLFEVLPGRFVRIVAFACHVTADAEAVLSVEHLEARWLPVDELGDGMIAGHRLPDGYLAAVRRALLPT